jgi:hypothetical protein
MKHVGTDKMNILSQCVVLKVMSSMNNVFKVCMCVWNPVQLFYFLHEWKNFTILQHGFR